MCKTMHPSCVSIGMCNTGSHMISRKLHSVCQKQCFVHHCCAMIYVKCLLSQVWLLPAVPAEDAQQLLQRERGQQPTCTVAACCAADGDQHHRHRGRLLRVRVHPTTVCISHRLHSSFFLMQTGHLMQCASSESDSHLLALWPTYLCMHIITGHACDALVECAQAAFEAYLHVWLLSVPDCMHTVSG